MEVKLTMRQAIQILSLAGDRLAENKKVVETARRARGGEELVLPALEKYNDDLVTLREDITAQLEFDDVVQM